ncbi:MAG TPA: hypothetical protein VKR43_02840 [Bryobacteraceae bacterium]|nr:hypothetical protein [Bryobacteraceae bacterium]
MSVTYFYTDNEAARAEEMIPSMTYRTLLENLQRLTDLGVICAESTVSMLVVARLVDRTRIRRSGVPVDVIQRTLAAYRNASQPVHAVIRALERAVEIALEDKREAAAHGAR